VRPLLAADRRNEGQIDHFDETIATLSERIEELIAPFSSEVELLQTIPGVDSRSAQVLIAEIGADMVRFPSPRHLASWAGFCPGNHESAGKRKSGHTRKGPKWLRAKLPECAKAAARSRGTYLSAHYHRLRGRRGPGKAAIAVAHSILICAYHMLDRGVPWADLGEEYFVRRQAEHADRYRSERARWVASRAAGTGPKKWDLCG